MRAIKRDDTTKMPYLAANVSRMVEAAGVELY
jgi:hypothetical protein